MVTLRHRWMQVSMNRTPEAEVQYPIDVVEVELLLKAA
jgi:hypothetical protein